MLSLLLTSLLLATAPAERATAVERATREARPLAHPRILLKVSSPQLRDRPRVFRASRITELQFDAVFAGRLTGSHVLELKLYTPRGYLYQVLTVPFSGAKGGWHRHLPGNPRVFVEREMRVAGPGKYQVSARLPVAGTWIMTNSLYGNWRVEAHLDGADWPSGRERFTIQP
jgi:hypothetical protein